jgi:hypothetical protein
VRFAAAMIVLMVFYVVRHLCFFEAGGFDVINIALFESNKRCIIVMPEQEQF